MLLGHLRSAIPISGEPSPPAISKLEKQPESLTEGGRAPEEVKLLYSASVLPMDGAAATDGSGEPTANGEKPQEQHFDPSRMIGIIKRRALIKELAAAYHADCVACCKELLQLQRKWQEEQYVEAKMPEEPRTSMTKPSKRRKK